jgi:hypothetical protein
MAVDGEFAYWADLGTLKKAPLQGGSATTLTSIHAAVWGMAVDAANVYWISGGDQDGQNATIEKLSFVDGSDVTLASAVARGDLATHLRVTDTFVYFEGPSGISRVPIEGGKEELMVNELPMFGGWTVDEASIYWVTGDISSTVAINKRSHDGGETTVLARPRGEPSYLVVDGTSLYWVDPFGSDVRKLANN